MHEVNFKEFFERQCQIPPPESPLLPHFPPFHPGLSNGENGGEGVTSNPKYADASLDLVLGDPRDILLETRAFPPFLDYPGIPPVTTLIHRSLLRDLPFGFRPNSMLYM